MRTSRLICAATITAVFGGMALTGSGCGDDPPPSFVNNPGGAGGTGGEGGDGGADGGCSADVDCGDGEVCEQSQCIPQTCVNDALDGDESDVDCGGSCLPCGNGQACNGADDCETRYCDAGDGAGGGGGTGGGVGGGAGGSDDGPGVCAACVTHDDCADAEGTYCDGGSCVAQKDNGEACGENEVCASGFCPSDDGVCCNENCTDTCEACTAAKTGGEDGVCGVIAAGEDPDVECSDQGAETCGAMGMGCNGDAAAPGCVLYPADTVCASAGCMNAQISATWECDGDGTCVADSPTDCAPYACDDAGTGCETQCQDHTDCDDNNYCNTTNNTCVPKISDGAGCAEDAQCTSGFCPTDDGVCCDAACSGECESCLGALNGDVNGTCGFTESGDPDDECPSLQACNGQGMCALL